VAPKATALSCALRVWASGVAVGALFAAGDAGAQAPGADGFDEIIVTETRAPRPLAEVIGNAARLGQEELGVIRAEHVSEALNRIPGVYLHRGSGQEHLTSIRSPVLTGGAGAGPILFVENGVPVRSTGVAKINGLFDAHTELAQSIEVVRGPGSVLYGSNAVHGLVNVLTPSAEATGAGLTFSGGSFGRYKGDVWASFAGDSHGGYAGFSQLFEGGYREDAGLDQQKLSLRHDYESDRVEVSTILSANALNQETAGFVIGDDAYLDPDLRRTNANPEAFRDVRAVRLSSRVSVALNAADELVVTPYARWNEMDFLLHFLPSQALEKNGHWSLGAQTAYYRNRGPISFIVGLDGEYTEGYLSEFQFIPTVFSFTQGAHYNYDVASIELAPYAHAEAALTPRLTVTGGVRVDWTRYDYRTNIPAGDTGRFRRPEDRADGFVTTAAKAGAAYALNRDANLYLAYARGARPPQTTDLYRLQTNQVVGEARPEKINSVEAGLRGRAGALSYDLAGYFMDKTNFFFRDADGFNVPNGRTRHVGAEADVVLSLGEVATLSAGAAYGRHTYRFDREVGRASETISFGDDVDTAPRWLANARADWRLAPEFNAELEWVFVGGYFTDAANDNTYPGHSVFNLRAFWEPAEGVRLFGTVRNLTDTLYAERADFAFGNDRFFPAEERAFSAGLALQY